MYSSVLKPETLPQGRKLLDLLWKVNEAGQPGFDGQPGDVEAAKHVAFNLYTELSQTPEGASLARQIVSYTKELQSQPEFRGKEY